ncbi:MAG: HEAT repeat domain-containing protein [Planctomycetes bacterium]|nr:HEAT repeat domain-containing protein [Planctomycetota bacterium]
MRYYCPGCWKDFAEDLAQCPECGLNIRHFYDSKDYCEKLILALSHPERQTPLRAAWILGQRRERRAVSALIELVRRTDDVYIATAAVEALGKIRTPEALAFLGTQTDVEVRMVRAAARRIVEADHGEGAC